MTIKIGSNINSLMAQRSLLRTTNRMSEVYERLSSGLRINRASDDPAGLSVASKLEADSRIYNQAIRNANDGISALNIADSALNELSSVVTRIAELAEQAANGVYSAGQRQALNKEAAALRDEYLRIVSTTEFNDTSLLTGREVTLQIDKNTLDSNGTNQGVLSFELGTEIGVTTGDGTFGDLMVYAGLGGVIRGVAGDVDGDGNLDIVARNTPSDLTVYRGNGDGTFQAGVNQSIAVQSSQPTLVDLDNDGDLDLLTTVASSNTQIALNDGNGNFSVSGSYGVASQEFALGDINNDGFLDFVNNDFTNNVIRVFINDQDGTFTEQASVTDVTTVVRGVNLEDVNGDNLLDILYTDDGELKTVLGDGTGGFNTPQSSALTGGVYTGTTVVGDFNGDGLVDHLLAEGNTENIYISLGNGDGTFSVHDVIASGENLGSNFIWVDDVDGDGDDDFIITYSGGADVYVNDGQANFTVNDTLSVGGTTQDSVYGDFNNDGVNDMAIFRSDSGPDTINVFLANTTDSPGLVQIDLTTQSGARQALADMREAIDQISAERSHIGAVQSRLGSITQTLSARRENVIDAKSRIEDADIAREAAELARLQILQQAATAVLAQANQSPTLALQLLT